MTDALPDAELLTVTYLRQHAATVALVGSRVYTEIPASPTWPLAKIVRIGGPPVARGTLDVATIQCEVYADTKAAARQAAATIQAAFADAAGFTDSGAYIADTEPLSGLQWIPDPDLADRPRYLFDTAVYTRST